MSLHTSSLFDSVSKAKHLPFYEHGDQTNFKKVVDCLGFDKKTVARATGLSQKTIRYDKGITKELKARINEWRLALEKVAEFFGGDINKTIDWFQLPNPRLGYVSPKDMIAFGRFNKLYKFILEAINENIAA